MLLRQMVFFHLHYVAGAIPMERLKLYCHCCRKQTTLVRGFNSKLWKVSCADCNHKLCGRVVHVSGRSKKCAYVCGKPSLKHVQSFDNNVRSHMPEVLT